LIFPRASLSGEERPSRPCARRPARRAARKISSHAKSAGGQEEAFVEGAEPKKGDLPFRLEQPPFQAHVEARSAAVAQYGQMMEDWSG
jgi:hypothetical protein